MKHERGLFKSYEWVVFYILLYYALRHKEMIDEIKIIAININDDLAGKLFKYGEHFGYKDSGR